MKKKQIFLRALYDFANSIVFANFLLYFSKRIVMEGGLSDLMYNALFAICAILLFFSAPMLASYTDRIGKLKKFLNRSTVGVALFYGLAAFSAISWQGIYFTALFFLFAQYFYQLCFVFYNPMIDDISDEKHRARVSGIGQFANALGQIVGLAIFLPLSNNALAPLLPAVGAFFLLALPMMIRYKDTTKTLTTEKTHPPFTYRQFFKRLSGFFALSISAPLLIAFFFYQDALVTITNNFSIYLSNILTVENSQITMLFMLLTVMNGVGALLSGRIGDKIWIKKTLIGVLISRIIILPLLAMGNAFVVFIALSIVLGLLIGAMWATSRAYMSILVAKEEVWYGFSFYTIMERFASILWPLTRGGIITRLGASNAGYRTAMWTMTAFVVVGLVVLLARRRGKAIERLK